MTVDQDFISSSQILKLLPHRYPFLLVDQVIEYKKGNYIKAIKNVTINEPFFIGHFPGFPVMPGVLVVESLAQTGGILAIKSTSELPENKIFLFTGIEKMRFKASVYPGDQLFLQATFLRQKFSIWKMQVEALVRKKTAAQGILTAALVDREINE